MVRELLQIIGLTALCAGCSASATAAAPVEPTTAEPAKQVGAPVAYEFASLDDRPVSSEALRGRATVLIFVTTYGDASMLQARFLKKVFKEYSPRFNAAAVFLERVDNRPLARIFNDTLELPYPAAMGDEASIAGKGPFTGMDTVPGVVVLDPSGREVWRKIGVAMPDELTSAIREAQRTVWGEKTR